MAEDLLFLDSSMHYATGDIDAKFNARVLDTIDASAARYGTAGHSVGSFSSSLLTFFENPADIYGGVAIKINGLLGQHRVHAYSDNAALQCYAAIEADGRVSIYNGFGTLLGQTTDFSVHLGRWYYFELFVTFHESAGAATLRVNSVTRLAVSGVRTITSNNRYCTCWKAVGLLSAGGGIFFTDTYQHKSAFQGDIRVGVIRPNGDTAANAWSLSTGASTFALLDDITPDETDYIYSNTIGQITRTEFEDVDLFGGVCVGAHFLHYSWKTNANVRKVQHSLDSGGTVFPGPEDSLSDTGKYYRYCLSADPATGVAWTKPGLDAVKYGVKLTA